MKKAKLRKFFLIISITSSVLISGCMETSQKWMKSDFENYFKNGGSFEFKCFSLELNLKMGIICENYLESKNSIEIFPANEIRDFLEKKYGVKIDISEFEGIRKSGRFKVELKKENKKTQIYFNKDVLFLDGTSVNTGVMGRYAITGTEWLTVNWSEYKEPVKALTVQNRLKKGLTDQMQVYISLAPIGSVIRIYLRVKDGLPDEKGYYNLKLVSEDTVKINFKPGNCNTDGLAKNITQLPELLNSPVK